MKAIFRMLLCAAIVLASIEAMARGPQVAFNVAGLPATALPNLKVYLYSLPEWSEAGEANAGNNFTVVLAAGKEYEYMASSSKIRDQKTGTFRITQDTTMVVTYSDLYAVALTADVPSGSSLSSNSVKFVRDGEYAGVQPELNSPNFTDTVFLPAGNYELEATAECGVNRFVRARENFAVANAARDVHLNFATTGLTKTCFDIIIPNETVQGLYISTRDYNFVAGGISLSDTIYLPAADYKLQINVNGGSFQHNFSVSGAQTMVSYERIACVFTFGELPPSVVGNVWVSLYDSNGDMDWNNAPSEHNNYTSTLIKDAPYTYYLVGSKMASSWGSFTAAPAVDLAAGYRKVITNLTLAAGLSVNEAAIKQNGRDVAHMYFSSAPYTDTLYLPAGTYSYAAEVEDGASSVDLLNDTTFTIDGANVELNLRVAPENLCRVCFEVEGLNGINVVDTTFMAQGVRGAAWLKGDKPCGYLPSGNYSYMAGVAALNAQDNSVEGLEQNGSFRVGDTVAAMVVHVSFEDFYLVTFNQLPELNGARLLLHNEKGDVVGEEYLSSATTSARYLAGGSYSWRIYNDYDYVGAVHPFSVNGADKIISCAIEETTYNVAFKPSREVFYAVEVSSGGTKIANVFHAPNSAPDTLHLAAGVYEYRVEQGLDAPIAGGFTVSVNQTINLALPSDTTYAVTCNIAAATGTALPSQMVVEVYNGYGLARNLYPMGGQPTTANLPNGTYLFVINCSGYKTASQNVAVNGAGTSLTLQLQAENVNHVQFEVRAKGFIEDATITLGDLGSMATDSKGLALFTNVPQGLVTYTVSKGGYATQSGSLYVSVGGDVISQAVMLPSLGVAEFKVYDGVTSTYLSGAEVELQNMDSKNVVNGAVTFDNLTFSNYRYIVSKIGYVSQSGYVAVASDTTRRTISLQRETPITVEFHVRDNLGAYLAGAEVRLGDSVRTVVSNKVTIANIATGSQLSYSVFKTGFTTQSGMLNIVSDSADLNRVITKNISMIPGASKIPVTLAIHDSTYTYNSTPRGIAVSVSCGSVSPKPTVLYRYNGIDTRPSAVGVYTVKAWTEETTDCLFGDTVRAVLTVNQAALTITASTQTKVKGENKNLGTTAFIVTGLLGSDAVTAVALTSAGASSVADTGSYAIVPSAAQGSGLANYNITYVNGALRVTAATTAAGKTPLSVNAVYPNPAKDYVNVNLGELQGNVEFVIFGRGGEVCSRQTLSGGAIHQISLQGLPSGMYIVTANGHALRLVVK